MADIQLKDLRKLTGDYLRQRGIPLRKPFRCLNPEHEDVHPSMSYNAKAGNVHCFSCGVTYDLVDLIGIDYGITGFWERYVKACELFGLEPQAESSRTSSNDEASPNAPKSTGKAGIARNMTPNTITTQNRKIEAVKRVSGHAAIEGENLGQALADIQAGADKDISWFIGRGITPDSIAEYGLFVADNRAYFPLLEGGECIGWCARAVSDDIQPRYKNSRGPSGIWNADILRVRGEGRRLFITEGIIDAICLCQMGENAVALCGSQNTNKLFSRIKSLAASAGGWLFVACGDPDEAGKKMNAALKSGMKNIGMDCGELILSEEDGDINELYIKNPAKLRELIKAESHDDDPGYASTSAAASLGRFFEEAERRASIGGISTGFPALDKITDGGLYPGLYVIGAISSLGKTGFVLQIADYIAEDSCDVMFFSLEQSAFELMARSISRTSAVMDTPARKDALTIRQLMGGGYRDSFTRRKLMEDVREVYSRTASGLFIREGVDGMGVEELRAAVTAHRAKRGKAPVVIVDYLQILKPFDARATDKQNTDHSVVELKRISRDFDTPVIAISSFNRDNYRSAVSMEAFKESGAVEYSSDVLFGLQLAGAGTPNFDVNRAKLEEPRKVELVMLKNRNGIPYAKVVFEYTAKFSLFSQLEAGHNTRG